MLVAIKEKQLDLIQKYFKVEKIYAFEPNAEALINNIDKSKYQNTKFVKKALGEKKLKDLLKVISHPLISLHKIKFDSNYYKFKQKL